MMKRMFKAAITTLVLSLAVVIGVVCAACSSDPVVFTDEQSMMGMNMTYTLTLSNKDDTFAMVVTTDSQIEENGPMAQILAGLGRTGTYKLENDVYTLTFSKAVKNAANEDVTTVTSKVVDGKQTLSFGLAGREATIQLNLIAQ